MTTQEQNTLAMLAVQGLANGMIGEAELADLRKRSRRAKSQRGRLRVVQNWLKKTGTQIERIIRKKFIEARPSQN